MPFGWRRKRPTHVTSSDTTTTSSPPPAPGTTAVGADQQAKIRSRAEDVARDIAAAWNALPQADREELEAAYAEQTALREEYGIENFRFCRRGATPESVLPDAETVRDETQMLRAMVTSANLPRVADPQH